jgi:hypothetical protein
MNEISNQQQVFNKIFEERVKEYSKNFQLNDLFSLE